MSVLSSVITLFLLEISAWSSMFKILVISAFCNYSVQTRRFITDMHNILWILLALIASGFADPVILDQCGGTIELDNGNLYIPWADTIMTSGQTCVWTIHLQNKINFKYRLPWYWDLPGGDSECSKVSIGIYSISNNISENLQGERFCSENYSSEDRFLDGNILVVIFKIDAYTEPDWVGFELTWEGVDSQDNPTQHTSSFTSAPSGILQYPFEGEYPPNSVQTWLVLPKVGAVDTEIQVAKINFEGCDLTDPCLCDALIIYDITADGGIEVAEKFCGERGSGEVTITGNQFVAVFFADMVDKPLEGFGFQMVWKGGEEVVTTPTTTSTTTITTTVLTTTTEDPNPPILSTCGGMLNATLGKIIYKPDESYGNSERCAWIIRSPEFHRDLYLTKRRSGFELGKDYLSIYAFDEYDSETTSMGKSTNKREERYLAGSVAVVVFTSDVTNQGQGFEMDFKFNGSTNAGLELFGDYFSSEFEGKMGLGGPSPGDHFGPDQLSVFVMSRNNTYYSDIGWEANLHIYKMAETGIIVDPCAYHGIRVYSVAADSLSFVGKFCSDTEKDFGPFLARNLYIFVLSTYSYDDEGGFEIEWKLR